MASSIKHTLFRIVIKFRALVNYCDDLKKHYRYFVRYHSKSKYSKDMMRCEIMLLNHQLEKAQTYSNMREGYGKQKIYDLIGYVEEYIEKYSADTLMYTSVGVISSHLNNPYSFKDEFVEKHFQAILDSMPSDIEKDSFHGGTSSLSSSDFVYNDSLLDVLKSRRSCRSYSDSPIKDDELSNALEYAMTAPSACNRQCVRLHYYENRETIKNIIYSQKSDVDWCLSAKGLIIVTANKSFFRDFYERNQSMFDAGLFSMSLVLGLHNQGIGSCFKMAQKDRQIEKDTKRIADIPDTEDICVLLLIGKYSKEKRIYAKSSRLDKNIILTRHE